MRFIAIIAFSLLALQQCSSRSLPDDDSVVSVYAKDSSRDSSRSSVAYLIASGLASRIASPFSNLLNFGKNVTTTTKRPFHRIELLGDMEEASKSDVIPLKNEISKDRDIEELSEDSIFKKSGKKPEKILMFSNFLPMKEKLELNGTVNEVDVDNEFNLELGDDDYVIDDMVVKSKDGGIVYVLEVIGSIIQLLWGGFLALFQPSSS
ncbi:hypothetical protein RR46_10271 [Papilio xuthus]|uniref:Uncharacterized protein n=1 Tax=Papilio xuthus TaxID=66420 RepID=A0A194Q0W3_PAPXU|nr:hypothetical protein RR46_10271 [Papilio xuthus]